MLGRRWMLIGLLLTALALRAAGIRNQQVADSLQADSINAAAAHPDFVKVWLVTVTPGNSATSVFGHAALRLQCVSEDLDNCFSFGMKTDGIDFFKFVSGSTKGGFLCVPTRSFISDYEREGRGVRQIQLNLLPHEEQELWRLLDHEVEQGPRWHYDFIKTSCTSMCIWAVENCLEGEHLEYHDLDPILSATYGEVMHSISAHAPWQELLINLRFFRYRNLTGDVNEKFSPELLLSSWQKASLKESSGSARPLTIGEPQTLCKADPNQVPTIPLLTPLRALLIVILLVVLIIVFIKKRKNKPIINNQK